MVRAIPETGLCTAPEAGRLTPETGRLTPDTGRLTDEPSERSTPDTGRPDTGRKDEPPALVSEEKVTAALGAKGRGAIGPCGPGSTAGGAVGAMGSEVHSEVRGAALATAAQATGNALRSGSSRWGRGALGCGLGS